MTNDVTITEDGGMTISRRALGVLTAGMWIPPEAVAVLREFFAAEDHQWGFDGSHWVCRAHGVPHYSSEHAAERDALAAVIDRIRKMAENDDPSAWDAHQELVRSILSSVPSEVLAERDARRDPGVAANALREFSKKVYNGASRTRDANFQAFYDYGLHPVLTAEADRIEQGLEP